MGYGAFIGLASADGCDIGEHQRKGRSRHRERKQDTPVPDHSAPTARTSPSFFMAGLVTMNSTIPVEGA